ncbi:MAG: hypothetical protein KF799_04380 [Bdellovibrionales bacterium]|nr:hypothetical protein [Bdellovibrionales bacterium]
MNASETALETKSTAAGEGFNQLAEALRGALAKFNEEQTPENFATIISALSAFGLSGVDLWKKAADYTRRHPLQVAALAGLAFFAARGLSSSARREPRVRPSSDTHH